MLRAKRTHRKSLIKRFSRKGSTQIKTSLSGFPPAYDEWLLLKERKSDESRKLREVKNRRVTLDRDLDAELRLCEIILLAQLGSGQYRVPKDAIQAISDALWFYHTCSKYTHWLFKPSFTNRRDSDPQQEHLKGLAVAFINQATSTVAKKANRKIVSKHFGLKPKRRADWEYSAAKGRLSVPDYTKYPYSVPIDEEIIEWAGHKYQSLKGRSNRSKKA